MDDVSTLLLTLRTDGPCVVCVVSVALSRDLFGDDRDRERGSIQDGSPVVSDPVSERG